MNIIERISGLLEKATAGPWKTRFLYRSAQCARRLCGAVVVDEDYDGRTNAGAYMPMRFPLINTSAGIAASREG